MKRLLLVLAVLLTLATPAQADTGLTSAVAAAYFPRFVDATLHTIAHQRVQEIAACGGCLSHDLMRAGTAEVLGSNSGYPDPIAAVVRGWESSRIHDGILSDRSLGRIGCAEKVVGATHYFACVLAAGPLPAGAGAGSAVTTLPNTAMR